MSDSSHEAMQDRLQKTLIARAVLAEFERTRFMVSGAIAMRLADFRREWSHEAIERRWIERRESLHRRLNPNHAG